jgi:hypothetical protein
MTSAEAHDLLDRCRAGANVPERQILEALQATGDLDFERQVTWRSAGEWSLPVGLAPAVWHEVLA